MFSRRKALILAGVAGIVGWVALYEIYPPESFYRSEFELGAQFELPESAQRLEGWSEWGMTAAVHEIQPGEWADFYSTIGPRMGRARDGESFCSSRSRTFRGDLYYLDRSGRYMIVGIDVQQRRVFWEIWHN